MLQLSFECKFGGGFSRLIKSSPSYLSVEMAITQSIIQLVTIRPAVERKLKSSAGQSFPINSYGKLSLSSWRDWTVAWGGQCGLRGRSWMPQKSNFLQFLISGYSRDSISYPQQTFSIQTNKLGQQPSFHDSNFVPKYAVVQCLKKVVAYLPQAHWHFLPSLWFSLQGKRSYWEGFIDNLVATEINC